MRKEKRILALGFFDGVHSGHAALLSACRDLAAKTGALPGALTFTSHPKALTMGAAPGLINTLPDRVRLLKALGMEEVLALPFDRAMMEMPWEVFFQTLLTEHRAAGLVWGHDFRCGRGGEGDGENLSAACQRAGIPFAMVPVRKIGGVTVSSTHIRGLLEAGEVEEANVFLGHPHLLSGTVTPGRGLGRRLGRPTASLAWPGELAAPKRGVYACLADFGEGWRPAAVNVGVRPTAGGGPLTVEAWLPGVDRDLGGKRLTLTFFAFLRPERKFPDPDALAEEWKKDGAQVLDFFEKKEIFPLLLDKLMV